MNWEAVSTVLFFGGVAWGGIRFATRMARDVVTPPEVDEDTRLATFLASKATPRPHATHVATHYADSWPLKCPRCKHEFTDMDDLLRAADGCPQCKSLLIVERVGGQLRLALDSARPR